jgi:hypothetical protein
MQPMPSRSSPPVLGTPHGVEHAMNLDLGIFHNPREFPRRLGRLLLYAFGGSGTSFVLGADWWVIALIAVAITVAVVDVELLRIRRVVRGTPPADGKRVFPPGPTAPPPSS